MCAPLSDFNQIIDIFIAKFLSDFDQIIEIFIAKFIATILMDAVVIAFSHLILAINISDSDRLHFHTCPSLIMAINISDSGRLHFHTCLSLIIAINQAMKKG